MRVERKRSDSNVPFSKSFVNRSFFRGKRGFIPQVGGSSLRAGACTGKIPGVAFPSSREVQYPPEGRVSAVRQANYPHGMSQASNLAIESAKRGFIDSNCEGCDWRNGATETIAHILKKFRCLKNRETCCGIPTWLYFLEFKTPYEYFTKIGVSENVPRRVNALSSAQLPNTSIKLLNSIRFNCGHHARSSETAILYAFRQFHAGGEFLTLPADLQQELTELCP
jgi:hypothetical protein